VTAPTPPLLYSQSTFINTEDFLDTTYESPIHTISSSVNEYGKSFPPFLDNVFPWQNGCIVMLVNNQSHGRDMLVNYVEGRH